jgi:hypothetical protein
MKPGLMMKKAIIYRILIMMSVLLLLPQVSCSKRLRNIYPLPKGYYNLSRLEKDLNSLYTEHSELASLKILGRTATGNNPIYALQIQTGLDRIPVLAVGQHHGDEVVGVEIALELARHLLENPANAKVRDLLDRYSFWIVPTLNPDGYDIVTSGKFEWKRKNNTDTNHNGKLNIKTDGVDLNRNYPLFWKLDKPLPESSPYYKGKSPASEAEVQAIMELASLVRFKYAFFYHSSVSGMYSEKIYLPWQDAGDKELDDEFSALHQFASDYATSVDKDYGAGTYSVHPGNTSKIGNSRNYFFYEYGTWAMDIEVCGTNQAGIGIIHPTAAMKDKVVQKNVRAIISNLLLQE